MSVDSRRTPFDVSASTERYRLPFWEMMIIMMLNIEQSNLHCVHRISRKCKCLCQGRGPEAFHLLRRASPVRLPARQRTQPHTLRDAIAGHSQMSHERRTGESLMQTVEHRPAIASALADSVAQPWGAP